MRHLTFIFCWLAMIAFPTIVSAEGYPDKPLRLVVPFPAGGPTDVIARVVGQKMSDLLGQPVVVDNRGGAGGVLGTDNVAKSPPDGYTIGLSSAGALAISASMQDKVPYDAAKDFTLLTRVASIPELLVVPSSLEATSVQQLVEMARAKPGTLNFASSGQGSMPHLAGELFRIEAKAGIVHVPYRGAAPAVTDLLGARVHMMFADIPVLLPHIQAGKLRALAVGSRERAPALPDVPTLIELGFPKVEAENWYGMVAPAGLPEDVRTKLHGAIIAAMKDPDVKEKLAEQGVSLVPGTPEEFATYLKSETVRWAEVIRVSGARSDENASGR